MDLETQLRLSVLVENEIEKGVGFEDIWARWQIKDLTVRAQIKDMVLRSSRGEEARAAGVAGIEAKARTGCPIMERVER